MADHIEDLWEYMTQRPQPFTHGVALPDGTRIDCRAAPGEQVPAPDPERLAWWRRVVQRLRARRQGRQAPGRPENRPPEFPNIGPGRPMI